MTTFQSLIFLLARLKNKTSIVEVFDEFLFIRLSDYRKAFISLWQSLNPQRVEVAAKQINAVEQETERLQRQIELLRQLRKAIAFLALDEKKSKK